jgi:hypothetical protein
MREGWVVGRFASAAGFVGLVAVALLAFASAASSATITSFSNQIVKGNGTVGTADSYPYCIGAVLLIQGSGFVTDGGVTAVTIGGVPAEGVTVGSDSKLYAQVGRGATGAQPITVTTPAGTATSTGVYTILPCNNGDIYVPKIESVIPAKAKPGALVQLIGQGFLGATTVTLSGKALTGYAIPSDSNLYLRVPVTAKAGQKLVFSITNSAGTAKATITVR